MFEQLVHGIFMDISLGIYSWNDAIFTARKRSLGQGNIFTPVCHSVQGGACMVAGGCAWL